MPNHLVRRTLAAGIVSVYGATNVVFCHAAEASFWSARRNASKKMAQTNAPSLPAPTDALILAQLPGGARLDFQGPFESSVIPTVPAKEHLVGGKVPVFASDLPRWLADVVTPYGNMRDVFLSKRPGAPLVIQIQDLHDSTEAQRNIAGLVEALQDERGISLVGLEGAQGAFATEAFRSFPDADITKAVAEHFMEEGYLGGPEFAGITAKRMPLLWGVEDMDGYKANVTAVKEAANNRPAVNLFLSEARQILDAIKDRRLSVRLLEFDKHLTGYHSRKEPLGAYVRYLLKSSPSSVAHVPNLVLLRDALHWEETLDFKRIEGERAELLERMVSHLSKPNLEQLVGRSAMYRLGRISYGDYYRFLRTLCENSGVKLDDYAQLSAYVRYVLLAERINRNDLLNELGSLERYVQDSLVSSKEEQRIVDSARHLALLERLVKHAYTPSDWVYHMTHESEILNVGNVIGSLAKETGTPHNLSPPTVGTLKPFEDFCLQALGRNGAMVKNLLEKMKAENRSTAVLVAGGFHTEGLTQLLRQKDISYAVVTPKVNGTLPDGHKTLDLLARDPAPLEKLFAGETVNIPTARMMNTENIQTSSLAGKLASLFVIFSLGLTVLSTNAPASSPAQLPSPLSAVAVPVPGTANAKITMGKKVFQIQWGTEGSAVSPGGYAASIPGYGITIMSKEATPLPWGQRLSASVRQMKTDFDSKMSWGWLLGLMGLGTIRRVGDAQTPLGVSPPQPVARVGDSTSANVSPTYTFSILSKEGMLLLAYENLLKVFPKNGLSQKELIDRIHQKQYLQDIRDLIRGEVVDAIGKMGADPESIITPELLKRWVGDRRNQTRILTPYVFQKPATYSLLESWGNLSQSGLKKFFGRHTLWGTALLEEWGWIEKKTGLLEGRMPAALAGVGLGILAVVFSLTILQGVGLAVAGSFIWSMVGPQLKFVLDHGSDQTKFQRQVRLGGTFLLNLVAVSVSAAVIVVGFQVGVDGTPWVFASLSPILGFGGAVLTHAIFEVLDILPDASSLRKPNFKDDSAKPSISQDPLGTPLTTEEETAELIKKWSGKTIAELDEVLRVVADHDLGGSVNDLTNKHSVGVLGESRSVDVVKASAGFSPYWWQRFWIKEGVIQVKGEISKGPGGDDYKMFFNESDLMKGGKSIAAALTEVIDAENDVMRDQFAFYSLEGPQFTNGKEEETAYLESITNAFEKEIGHWGRMSIVRHGNGVTIAVKREYPGEKLSSIVNRLDKLGSWRGLDMTRPGLGLFTYSMGGLRLGDVVRRLTFEYPELNLLAEDGTLRPETVPVVMMWADRLAEDMLAVAKGRGRKQVFIANDLADVYSFERPGTVTEGNIKQTLEENSGPSHAAFKVSKAEEFWKDLKNEKGGHVLIFEVAQYRKQGLRWGVNAISEWVFRHLPAVLFRFVPERWVRGLEKRIQSRAFHSWQGSDQHGKGNDAIKAHHEMVTSLDSKATNLGRAVDTFYSFSRGPPSLNQLIPAAETMRNKLATQHPDEKKKLHPFHVVYDFNLADWSAFLVENRNPGPKSSDRGQPRLSLEDVAGMQNAVVTYLGRRYGGEILLEKLREFFVVQPSEDVFLISMDVKGDGAKERFRKMELVFRKAQAENARAAKLVLNARPPIRMGSFFFSIMAKGVERGMKVSPARARQIVSGRYVQSLLVSLAELPFLPYLSIGFSLLVASVVGPWVGVIAGSFLMALLHGKPVMTRGPPSSLFVQKDQFGRPIESQQTLKQFAIRFLVAVAINTFAIFVGGVDPTLAFTPQSLPLESLNLWNAGLTGYLSHALYNFVAPESYRLSLARSGQKGGEAGSRETEFQLLTEISEITQKRDQLLETLAAQSGDRLKTFREISELRYLPPGKNAEGQIQNYMDRVLRQMTLPGANMKSKRVADPVLFEAVFYEKGVALKQMLEARRRGHILLSSSEKALAETVALVFVPLASRLGWHNIADQLADIAFELLEPDLHRRLKTDLLEGMGFTSLEQMDQYADELELKLIAATKALLGDHVYVRVRRKRLYSIAAKMKNKPETYRSARDIKDAFNAVVVFNKKRADRDWKVAQGLLYNQIYAVLQAQPIEGYRDGKEPKDSFEPKGREDVHVLFRTARGFIETQFKSWSVFNEYKSKGQVTDRWKKPPHWMYKTTAILKALYNIKNINLKADSNELTADVGKNLEGVTRGLLPYEFPMVSSWIGSEGRVVRVPAGSTVLDLAAHPDLKIPLESVPQFSAQRFALKEGQAFPGDIDRRQVGQESLTRSSDVFYFAEIYSRRENPTLPASGFSLRARLSLLPKDLREKGLQLALLQLRDLSPGHSHSQGLFAALLRLMTFAAEGTDHRQEVFMTTAQSIAAQKGLASVEELYSAWGTGLLTSEELGRSIFDEGKKLLANNRMDISSSDVLHAFQNMLEESDDINRQIKEMPPILGKCADMLLRENTEDLGDKMLFQMVLGVGLGILPMNAIRSNFPSVSIEERATGQSRLFTIRGVDRVGFIHRIVQILNEHGASVDSIEAPPAEPFANETLIRVKTRMGQGSAQEQIRSALSSIALAESGPMPGDRSKGYRLTILHENNLKPLEVALDVLERFGANITEVPSVKIAGERIIDFQINPTEMAELEGALNKKAVELDDHVFFSVSPLPSPRAVPLHSVGGMLGFSFFDPTGVGYFSLAGIVLVLLAFVPGATSSIKKGLIAFRQNALSRQIGAGLALFIFSTGMAFGSDFVTSVAPLFIDQGVFLSSFAIAAGAMFGVLSVTGGESAAEIAAKGGSNKVNRVEFGVALHYKPLSSNGGVVPFVSYSLRNPGDRNDVVIKRVRAEQSRVLSVFNRMTLSKGVKKRALVDAILKKINREEINAQTAVVEALDAFALGGDAERQAVLRAVKDELLRSLLDNHSVDHLGYSVEELARIKEREVDLLNAAFEKLISVVNERQHLATGEDSASQAVREGAEIELLQLEEIRADCVGAVNQKSTTALGALIGKLREVEGFLESMGEEMDPKMNENFTQAIDNILAVIQDVQIRLSPEQIPQEVARLEKAMRSAMAKVNKSQKKELSQLGQKGIVAIRQGWKAEAALARVEQGFSNAVVFALINEVTAPPQESSGESVVVFSKEVLTPNDLTRLRQQGVHVVGVVSSGGNRGSHSAIVAQSLKIPFVTGALVRGQTIQDWAAIVPAGAFVGVDGSSGEVYMNPSNDRLGKLEQRQELLIVNESVYENEAGQGTPLPVAASPDDRDELEHVSDPVGLIRTEYLFNHPSLTPLVQGKPNKKFEEYLVDEFARAARLLNGKRLDIRVIDNQGQDDKPLSGVPQKPGGATGIEFLLRDPVGRMIALQEVRAIIRAYQNNPGIRLFFPLVSTLEDAADIELLVKEALDSLPPKEAGAWQHPDLGYMIETPGGVMNAALLAKHVKFFSVGSTDLTRSTFNKARNDPSLDRDLGVNRPEISQQLKAVLEAAKNAGIEVNVCGALASSRVFWPMAMALNKIHPIGLSIPPPLIPEAKYYLRRLAQKSRELEELSRLLDTPGTTADQLTTLAQKMISDIESGVPNEDSYKRAMESLRRKKQSTLLSRVVIAVFVLCFVGGILQWGFPGGPSLDSLLNLKVAWGGISSGGFSGIAGPALGSGNSGNVVLALLGGVAVKKGALRGDMGLGNGVDGEFTKLITKINNASNPREVYGAGRALVASSLANYSLEDLGKLREKLDRLEAVIGSPAWDGARGRTVAVLQIQLLMEAVFALAHLRAGIQPPSGRGVFPEIPSPLPMGRSSLQRQFAEIHRGVLALGQTLSRDDKAQEKIDALLYVLLKLDLTHWDARRVPGRRMNTFDYLLMLSAENRLGELPLSPKSNGRMTFPLLSSGVGPFSLFGRDFLTPVILAASISPRASEFVKGALLKLGITWDPAEIRREASVRWWLPRSGLFALSAIEIHHIIRVAGYSVLPESPHDAALEEALRGIHLHRWHRQKFMNRVHVLRSGSRAPTGFTENEFAFFVRDSNGSLTIFVHEKTLDEWKGRGDIYYRSALEILFYHEWAESFGVLHEELVEMGLTLKGLDALLSSRASQEEIQWEIRARGLLALGMVIPDPRILDVQARKNAETALSVLFPEGLPRGVESYIAGPSLARRIADERRTWAERAMYQLRSSIPGLENDSFAEAVRGDPNERYQNFLPNLGAGGAGRLESLIRSEADRIDQENELSQIPSLELGQDKKKIKYLNQELARDILLRVFRLIRSMGGEDFSVSAPALAMIKKELSVLHRVGGSLFLNFNRVDDAKRSVAPGERRLYQERDLAWLDEVLLLINETTPVSEAGMVLLKKTSDVYQEGAAQAQGLVGAFDALDESLFDESATPVIRIPEILISGTGPLTGDQRTVLRVLTALARRAEVDHRVAARVVFLVDPKGGEEQNTDSLLRKLESRMGIENGSLSSLSTASIMDSQGLFKEEMKNNRILRTYNAKALFEKVGTKGISSKQIDIYSVPPSETLAEIWDISGMDSKAGFVLRLIELWASNVAIRVSSQYNEDFVKRMRAIKQSA